MEKTHHWFDALCIRKRLYLFLLFSIISISHSFAQSKEVSGTIKGEDGMGMPGANIVIKGSSTGTATDVDGKFTITVPDTNAVLVISNTGYTAQEVKVGGKTTFDIPLTADVALSEVVVVGYGTQERKDISGSISSVTAEQIAKVPVTTIDQALQGRSAGVQVTNNDGSPGAGITVQIRGVGSFGDNGPLYVVDGYPISGNLNSINPNDIASMEVLKDASATAIYGSRASNGVVIITTKRGKKDGLQLSFDAFTTVQSRPKMYKVLNAQEFATFATQVATQYKYPVLPEWSNPSSLTNIDWQKELYQTGLKQSYNIALRGGSEKVQTAFSVGYLNHKGIVKLSDFVRYNATANLDYSPFKWLKTSTSVKYTRTDGAVRLGSGINGLGLLTKLAPTMTGNPQTSQVKDANGNYGYYTKSGDGATAVAGMPNILADIEQQDRQSVTNNLLTSSFVEVTVLKDIRLKTNFGINLTDNSGYYFTPTNNRSATPPQAFYSQSSNNTFEWLWENTIAYNKTLGIHSLDIVAGISAQRNQNRQLGIQGSGLISNELRSVGSLEKITSTYGYQQPWALASQFGRLTYKLKDRYILTGTVRRDGSSRFGEGNKYGIFPSVAAAWKIKEESFLADAGFVSDLKLRGSIGQTGNQNINLFQYQQTYTSGTSLVDNRGYVFGSPKAYYPGIALSALPNPNLRWESTTQTDIGADASFLNGKISLTVDYYNKLSSRFLINNIPIPSQTGFTNASRNVGTIRNRGVEVMAGYRDSQGDFKYGISANITTVNNRIMSLLDRLKGVPNFTTQGFPNYGDANWVDYSLSQVGGQVGAFYGYKSAGIFQTQAEIDALNAHAAELNKAGTFYQTSKTLPGDRKFEDQLTVDTNGDGIPDATDGKITDDDRVIIGSPIPKWFGGLNADAAYKQFDLSLFFYVSYGNQILNYAKRNLQSLATNGGVGVENVSEEFYLNHWTPENHSNTYTRAVAQDVSGNTRVSDAYVEDGSFVRLRNIQLGYTLPGAFTNKIFVSKARFYISAQNLLTFTKYSGLDPEVGQVSDPNSGSPTSQNPNQSSTSVTATGIDLGNFPNSRMYTFGLSLQF